MVAAMLTPRSGRANGGRAGREDSFARPPPAMLAFGSSAPPLFNSFLQDAAMTTPDLRRPFDPDSDDVSPSLDFARALEAFERGGTHAAAPAAVARELVVGDKVRGRVVAIGETHALVDYGGRSEALADLTAFRNEQGVLGIAVGDMPELFVVESGEQVVLSPVAAGDTGAPLQMLREARAAGMPVTGRVTGVNAGGLAVEIGGVRGFCPVSQIDTMFVTDPSVFVGRTLEFIVTRIEDGRGGVVLSRRQQLVREQQQKAQRALAALKVGDVLEGKVARLEPFGAFVDLGGVDGMVHISEIGFERLAHPRERLAEGQVVRVQVLSMGPMAGGKSRVALSIKATLPDPWTGIEARFQPGMRTSGVVSRLAEFGAFVQVAPGVDGLVHVSEAALGRVRHVKDVLAVGDTVEVVVVSVDAIKKRIALSVKQALGGQPAQEPASASAAPAASAPAAAPAAPPSTELTPMAIALRKAMEKARQRGQDSR